MQHRLSAPLLIPPSPQLLATSDLSAGSRVLLVPECQSTEIIDVLVFLFLWGKRKRDREVSVFNFQLLFAHLYPP